MNTRKLIDECEAIANDTGDIELAFNKLRDALLGGEWECPTCHLVYDSEPEEGCSYPDCGKHV